LKSAFFLVKLLEDNGYNGSRHFDVHAYRTEDYEGVKDFARGCMRTYLIHKGRGVHNRICFSCSVKDNRVILKGFLASSWINRQCIMNKKPYTFL
jgi:hypothetical protein